MRAQNKSHESKLLMAQVNNNQTRIHSCSPEPGVTLSHDSYFLAPIQTVSVIDIRGCEELQNQALSVTGVQHRVPRI